MLIPLISKQYATVSLVMQEKDRLRRDEPLEVIAGEIRIGKELTEIQRILRVHFFTCYAIGVMFLSTMQIIGLLGARAYWKHYQKLRLIRQMREGEEADDPSETLELDESQLEHETSQWEDMTAEAVREEQVEIMSQSSSSVPNPSTAPAPTEEQSSR
mmetsp:Transcript_21027/g.60789  ORF Transcript_21027/g.60789 Transcript_21027/m.60789 type:complete len:158 (+) Transcript_21027:138-611(+)